MVVTAHTRKVLDKKGIEVVRAKYIKEIAVTGDTADDLKKEIAFGGDKVSLGEVAEWLSNKARSNSRRTKVASFAAVAAAGFAFVAALISLVAWLLPIRQAVRTFRHHSRRKLEWWCVGGRK
jgi:hypothetical protein